MPSSLIGTARSVFAFPIPTRSLALFFDTLAVQIHAGSPIPNAMISASICSGDEELQAICRDIAPHLSSGQSLFESLKPYYSRFPELAISLIEVGEVSGSLGISAERLASTYKQQLAIQRDIKLNVYDPWMYLLGICLIYTVFQIQGGLQDESPLDAAWEILSNDAFLAAFLIFWYFILRSLMPIVYRWELLRLIVDTVKLALPRLGLVSRNLSASRWARSFAVLWSSGINISTALEISSRSALNIHYEKALAIAADHTRRGRPLSESLAATQMLPRNLLTIIRSSEITGRMDEQLQILAASMEREAFERSIVEMNRMVFFMQAVGIAIAVIYIFSQSSI